MTTSKNAAPRPAVKLTEIRTGEVLRLKVPMELPGKPGEKTAYSGSVNSYLVRAAGGRWAIIDPGLYTPTSIEAWTQTLRDQSIGPEDIDCILLTHYHSDHAGMAGWFRERTAAPIYMHPKDVTAFALEWGDRAKNVANTVAQMRAYGMDGPAAKLVWRQTEERTRFISPCGSFVPMEDGSTFPVCKGALRALHVPGHTDGQCAFLWPERKLLFAADLLLPASFSPVCLHHFGDQNPMGLFLSTLEDFPRLDLEGYTVLPGHGWPFEDPAGRARLEAQFYQDRAQWCYEKCAQGMDTAWAIARVLHREIGAKRYLRSIMWETMACMEYLAQTGRVTRRIGPEGIFFLA